MSGIASAFVAPTAMAALPTDPDVVIIGAGAAGIAAAHRLIAEGKSVVVVEAADRIGGRAYTESETFGLPYDHGCAWLQGPETLPYLAIAKERNFGLVDHNYAHSNFFVGNARAKRKEANKYDRTWERIAAALERAPGDVSAASVLPENAPYSAVTQTWVGPLDHGVDFADLSTADYNSYAEYDMNYLVEEGLGTLVALHGAGLPISLNTTATHVDWSGSGVKVETSAGTISAKACIVTVSTGVLGAGKIKFTPEMPIAKAEAVANVPMGLLVKVPLQFDGRRFGLSENGFLTYAVDEPAPSEACYFLTFPNGHDLAVGFVGGKFGWEMSHAGEAATIDFALEEFVKMFGSKARDHFIKGHMSDWATNPLTMGAYSAAKPGHHADRAVLAEPMADKVFFAGEAVSPDLPALCSGAHLSGDSVGADVAVALNGGCSSCDARGSQKKRPTEPTE